METVRFEWDEAKNETNISKHKVSFQEAQSVFYDPYARVLADPEHSEDEERFIILGLSEKTSHSGCVPLLSRGR